MFFTGDSDKVLEQARLENDREKHMKWNNIINSWTAYVMIWAILIAGFVALYFADEIGDVFNVW